MLNDIIVQIASKAINIKEVFADILTLNVVKSHNSYVQNVQKNFLEKINSLDIERMFTGQKNWVFFEINLKFVKSFPH